MSPPEIITTGRRLDPFEYKTLPGEPVEAASTAVKNTTIIASLRVRMGDPGYAIRRLEELGMGRENASAIVEAASNGTPGVGVRFEAVFPLPGITTRPTKYRNFELVGLPEKEE